MTEESREVAEARAELWITLPDSVTDVAAIAAAKAVNESIDRLVEAVRKDERERVTREQREAMRASLLQPPGVHAAAGGVQARNHLVSAPAEGGTEE